MVWDEPTPLMLGLCIYGWINGYLSLCLNLFLSADLALSLNVLRQLNLTSMYVPCPTMPIQTAQVKMAQESNRLTEKGE